MMRLLHSLANRDSLAGLSVVGACALAWWLTAGFDEVPAMLSQNVPPTFFPRLVIATAALLGGVVLLNGIRRRAEDRPGAAAASGPSARAERAGRTAPPPPVFWATLGLVVAAGVSIPFVGTLPTLGLIALVLPLLWGERRLRLVVALALGLPGAIHVVFGIALGIRFPIGQVWSLL